MHTFYIVLAFVSFFIAGGRIMSVIIEAFKAAGGGNANLNINFVALLWVGIGLLSLVAAHLL